MLPTLIVCNQLMCFAISVESTPASYAECESHFQQVELYVKELQLTNVLFSDSFVMQRECRTK